MNKADPRRQGEFLRIEEERRYKAQNGLWRKWGPYLSERQWGTVREDYSEHGNAWEYLPHDHARSRAYRWGEDCIAGFADHHQRLCLSLALWNARDPILKERLFGLTNGEGNHGEDCKELYYHLDATPTHAYLRILYKYPQREFPCADLVHANRSRGKDEPEYELLDTGVFDEDRYFDVFVEYGRINPTDVNMLITVHNRGPETAVIHLLPQLWFRNTWSWKAGAPKPLISAANPQSVNVTHRDMGEFQFFSRGRTNGCLQTMKRMSDASMTPRRAAILGMPFTTTIAPVQSGAGHCTPARDCLSIASFEVAK